jgi:hypothetical protein
MVIHKKKQFVEIMEMLKLHVHRIRTHPIIEDIEQRVSVIIDLD